MLTKQYQPGSASSVRSDCLSCCLPCRAMSCLVSKVVPVVGGADLRLLCVSVAGGESRKKFTQLSKRGKRELFP